MKELKDAFEEEWSKDKRALLLFMWIVTRIMARRNIPRLVDDNSVDANLKELAFELNQDVKDTIKAINMLERNNVIEIVKAEPGILFFLVGYKLPD